MSELFGTFSEPPNLAVGDPYHKPGDATGRWAGKQFSIVPPKEGKAPDAYLDKEVRSNALGDRYIDAWILDKRLCKKPGKALSDKRFHLRVGAANTSISCGPGSNDGCLSTVLYDTDGSSAALRSNPPRRPADKLRNIYTSAPKKGGFGMPWKDMTLGEPPKYYMDVYDGGRLVEKELRKTSKPTANKPFVSAASKSSRTFTSDTQVYHQEVRPQTTGSASSSGRTNTQRSMSASREQPQAPVWRPSSGRKLGAAASAFGLPEYVPDPVREAKYHGKDTGKAVKPFRPASGPRARLSMWSPNPYTVDARPPPSIDFTIT